MPVLCLCVIARKHIDTKSLMKLHPFLQLFNTELGRFRYTVMPFGATVAGDVFQCKLDQCFGHLKNVTVIVDDLMIVCKKPSHSNHDQALPTILETARKCNTRLNYDKLQYKRKEVDFLVKHTLQVVTSQIKTKAQPLPRCLPL